jgi:hypothetical protein
VDRGKPGSKIHVMSERAGLSLRYERKANHFLAFLTLATANTCFKELRQTTT